MRQCSKGRPVGLPKRILSCLLAFVMIAGLLPLHGVVANAAESGEFELPLAGTHGICAGDTDGLKAGTAFTILEEQGDKFLVYLGEEKGTQLVTSSKVMVNLPDLIPSIIYKDSNAQSSEFRSLGNNMSVTGTKLYAAKQNNAKLGYAEYIMPVQYIMAKKIMQAQKVAQSKGLSIVLYEGFRPMSAQESVKNALNELAAQNQDVNAAINHGNFSKSFYIAQGASNHQRGAAVDVSLATVNSKKTITVGDRTVEVPDSYKEFEGGTVSTNGSGVRSVMFDTPSDIAYTTTYSADSTEATRMPTKMHELSYLAGTFNSTTSTYVKGDWQKKLNAGTDFSYNELWTQGAKTLQDIFVGADMEPLSSEWWHFNDLDANSWAAKDSSVTGNFEVGNNSYSMSQADVEKVLAGDEPSTQPGGGVPGGVEDKPTTDPGTGTGTGPVNTKAVIHVMSAGHLGVGPATVVLRKVEPNAQDKQFQTDNNGDLVLQWSNPSGDNYIEPGQYTLTLKQVPAGYEMPEGDEVVHTIRFYTEERDGTTYYLTTGPVTITIFAQHTIKVCKKGNGQNLAGATFDVYYNTKLMGNITTDKDGVAIYDGGTGGLHEGVYKFVETIPPVGYMLGTEAERTQEVHLDSSNVTNREHVLTFEDKPFPAISVTKLEAGTPNKLGGALFEVMIDGTSVGEYKTDDEGQFTIDYDTYGTFIDRTKDSWTISVREITAPAGYMIDDGNWQIVELHAGQTLQPFTFTDTKYPEIVIKKVKTGTDEGLGGAVFELAIDTVKVNEFITDDNGEIHVTYDEYGSFLTKDRKSWTISVRETVPPKGYFIDAAEPQTVELKQGMKLEPFVFTDTPYPEIVIRKVDKESEAGLKDATFKVEIEGQVFQEQMTTDENGYIRISHKDYERFLEDKNIQDNGWTVTVTEVKAPAGYNRDFQGTGDYTQTQQMRYRQSKCEFLFKDVSYRSVQVIKEDSSTGWPLKGATFILESIELDDGKTYRSELTTDETGSILFEDVPNGTYRLWESQAPYGYSADNTPITFSVNSSDPKIITKSFKNEPLAGLRIIKRDAVTDQPIAGALFSIEPLAPLNAPSFERETDGNGLIVIQDLAAGSYKITELSAPSPYVTDSTPQVVEISNKHDDVSRTFYNYASGMLYIQKFDSVTSEPLAGAYYRITTAGGTYVADVGPTGPNGYASYPNLKPGSYIVTETKAPAGHELDTTPKYFEVSDTDSAKIYVLYFCNNPKANLWIRKVDALTDAGLEGAVFKITSGSGKVIAENATTDHSGFIKINNLDAGTYVIQEIEAPKGYILDGEKHIVNLRNDDTEVVRIENSRPGGISVRKVDARTGAPLEGAVFQLYDIKDTLIGGTQTSGKDGYVRWSDLEAGMYQVREVSAPDGYVTDNAPVKLEVKEFGTTEHIWENTQQSSISIVKRDAETLLPLSGAVFNIQTPDGNVVDTLTTSLTGVATSKRLSAGWYQIVETKAPIGYAASAEPKLVEVKENTPVTVEIPNVTIKGITIHKIDAVTKAPLGGAWFELQKADGTVVQQEFSTDSSGTVTTTPVAPGDYYLVETKAPEGYVRNEEKILVQVKVGEAKSITIQNAPKSVIQIYKTDAATGAPVAGAGYMIYYADGREMESVYTDETGWAYSKVVPAGQYLVREFKAPDGYALDPEEHAISVADGQSNILRVTDVPGTVLHITKVAKGSNDGVANSKIPLSGAVFELYATCGIEPCIKLGQYTTDEYGQAVTEPLAPGIYKLKEVIAPLGYILDEQEYEVCIKAGEYNNIVIENQEGANLIVRKFDNRTNEPLPGAVFKVETADHDLIGLKEADANGEATFTGLKAGHYIVTETVAPEGYSISNPASQTITVSYGTDNYCDFKDTAFGSLTVVLQDKHTGAYLAGGNFVVIRESDQTVVFDSSTDVSGTLVIGNLAPGFYTVEQKYAPAGYTMVDIKFTIEVLSGQMQTVYFKDETAGLTIEKVDAKHPNQTLEGARFQVVRESDGIVIGEYVTDKSGLALVSGLTPGRYTVSELIAPVGYIKMDEPKTIEVKGGMNTHVTFANMPRTSITINVVEQDTRKGIAGNIVEVWAQNGNLVNTFTSDSTGVIETQKLENGFYVLKLVKVADGYTATTTEATVELTDAAEATHTFELISNGVLKVTSTNSAGIAIPGMRFTLTAIDGTRVGTFTTGTNGTYTFASLAPGWYTVTEDRAPDGFTIQEETKVQQVEVKAGTTAVTTFAHTQIFGLQIRTTCKQTGAAVPGVKYKITTMTGVVVGTYTSDEAGVAFAALAPAWYVVTPVEAPKGYTFTEDGPRNVQVMGDRMTTTDFVVTQQSSLRVKVVDGSTGAPIFNVRMQLRNGESVIQEYYTNNEGYINLNQSIVAGGYLMEIISAPEGYLVDSMPRSLDVLNAETTEIVWKLYKEAAQIQVVVTSSDYNRTLDLPAGTPLAGAVFEITNLDTYQVMGQMISDTAGVAASSGLPVGRYSVKMLTAPAYYGVNESFNPEIRLVTNNHVVRTEVSVQSVTINLALTQQSNTTIAAGNTMRVDVLKADNESSTRLDDYYIHIKVPTDVARVVTLQTGTWNHSVWYTINYKTNMQDYRQVAGNLRSVKTYHYDLSAQSLGLASGEYVTDIRLEFGTVPAGFKVQTPSAFSLYVLSTAANNYKLVSRLEMGGRINAVTVNTNANTNLSATSNGAIAGTGGQAVTSGASGTWTVKTSVWTTTVTNKSPVKTLPKTGY